MKLEEKNQNGILPVSTPNIRKTNAIVNDVWHCGTFFILGLEHQSFTVGLFMIEVIKTSLSQCCFLLELYKTFNLELDMTCILLLE